MIERNKIPTHWKIKSISDVCDILDGLRRPVNSTERTKRINGKTENELFPYYGATGQVGLIDDYILDGEYILLGEDGAPFLDPFKDKAYLVQGKMWVNNHAHILKSRYSNKFLYYYLNNVNYKEFVSGTTRLKLNQSSLREIPVPMPPITEQHLIVEKIEELFSELNAGKQLLETVKEQLKTYRQAVLKYAFEGKLTNENVREGELPKGWKLAKIMDLVAKDKNALKAGPFGSSLKKECYVKDGYKVYGQEQVISGDPFLGDYFVSNEKFEELNSNKVQAFDVLISLVGTVGKVLVLPENCRIGIINPRLIKITLDQNSYLPRFFKLFFESASVKRFYSIKAQGTTMDVLNLGIIKTILFPVPTIEEQRIIIEEVESRLSVCDNLEKTIEFSLKQAEILKQSILKKAFEGNLVKPQTN